MVNFLAELKRLKEESEVKNVVFKLEIPKDAEELLALKKDAQMAAIEGEEEGDGSFIQNQDIVTVEYITREGNKILVYPMHDTLKSKDVSGLGERLQKAFTSWCHNYSPDELDESVTEARLGHNADESEAMEVGVTIGEIGEKLMDANSALNSSLERQLGKLEAKHEVNFGEDFRELKQHLKMAIRVVTKLNDALTDLPLKEAKATTGPLDFVTVTRFK